MGKFVTIHNPENEMVSVDAEGSISVQSEMVPGVQPIIVPTGPSNFMPSQKVFDSSGALLPEIMKPETTKIEIVEKVIYVDRPVEVIKEVQVPVEKIVYQDRIVEKEVIKEVPKNTVEIRDIVHERIVEIPKIVVQRKAPEWCYLVMGAEALLIALFALI